MNSALLSSVLARAWTQHVSLFSSDLKPEMSWQSRHSAVTADSQCYP